MHGPDAVVRSAAVEVLRTLRLGDRALFATALTDPAVEVRIQAVRALVSVDASDALQRAAADPSREVRVAAAHGLGTVGGPDDLAVLLHDEDLLVRAAALAALATTGCPPPYDTAAVAALGDPAWQVRAGAATALAAADPELAVPALRSALADPNADVRKAGVLALARHSGRRTPARPWPRRPPTRTRTSAPTPPGRCEARRSPKAARERQRLPQLVPAPVPVLVPEPCPVPAPSQVRTLVSSPPARAPHPSPASRREPVPGNSIPNPNPTPDRVPRRARRGGSRISRRRSGAAAPWSPAQSGEHPEHPFPVRHQLLLADAADRAELGTEVGRTVAISRRVASWKMT